MTLFRLATHDRDLTTWLDRGIVLAVLLACGVALSLNVADPDLWGHVQYGRDALAHGLPATTTYSYVADGYRWINHEIVAEFVLAVINDSFGGPGLLLFKWLLGTAVIGAILWRAQRSGASLIAGCCLAVLVALALGNHWSLRPQLISYACFTMLLALLSYCFEGWEGNWQFTARRLTREDTDAGLQCPQLEYSVHRLKHLWLVVPLFVVWTNSHGGFLAGLAVFIAYLGLRGVEAVWIKGRAADGLVRRFALMAAAAIAATFINPYGPDFHVWLFDDLKVPRPEILEWRAPELFDPQFLRFWLLLVVAVAALVLSRRQRDLTQVTILGLILWQALQHHRHIAFFAIACGWWLPGHFHSLLSRAGAGTDAQAASLGASLSRRMQYALGAFLLATIGLCSVQLAGRLTTLKVDRSLYPVAAFDFIAERSLTGKMVCTFNWAQYALAAFGPRQAGEPGILVQVDGRCRTSYSQRLLDMHFDFLFGAHDPNERFRDPKSGPVDPARILEFERPDLALISRTQRPSVAVMEQESRKGTWVLLYQDALAQVWGRASRYDDPMSSYFISREERAISDAPQNGIVRWPALPHYEPFRDAAPLPGAHGNQTALTHPLKKHFEIDPTREQRDFR